MIAARPAHAALAAIRHPSFVAEVEFTESLAPSSLVVANRDLEALLIHRSGAPVSRYRDRRAFAPLGLAISTHASPRSQDGWYVKERSKERPFGPDPRFPGCRLTLLQSPCQAPHTGRRPFSHKQMGNGFPSPRAPKVANSNQ